MDGLVRAFSSMAALLIVTVLGVVAAKLGYLNADNRSGISKLILNVTMPCTIIASVGEMDPSQGAGQVAAMLGLAAAVFPIMLAGGALSVLLLRVPRADRKLYLFMSTFTNLGFVGIAVVASVYGGPAAFLGSVVVAVVNLLLFSVGALIFSGEGRLDLKSLVNAPLIAATATLLLFASGLRLPDVLQTTVELAGGITAPLAMMLVGLSVTQADLGSLARDWRLYGLAVIRFLVVPALAWLAARLVVSDPVVLGVFATMLAMPVASMAPAIAAAWGKDPNPVARGTIVTTITSFVTVTALFVFMELISSF